MRFKEGREFHGVAVLEVLRSRTNYRQSMYRVKWECGCTEDVNGNVLTTRYYRLKKGGEVSAKCRKCARVDREDRRRAKHTTPSQTMSAVDALRMMR